MADRHSIDSAAAQPRGQLKRSVTTDANNGEHLRHHAAPTQQHQHQPAGALQQQHRTRSQKHVVGGGGTAGRLHQRVPSSKALHKLNNNATSALSMSKLLKQHQQSQQPIQDPRSPDERAAAAAFPPLDPPSNGHRRIKSTDALLSHHQSFAPLKKNTSQVSLKQIKTQAKAAAGGKRNSKQFAQLKRAQSERSIPKSRPLTADAQSKSTVHFDLGGGQDQAEGEEEWVDASNTASPFLSRQGSIAAHSSPKARRGSQATESTASVSGSPIRDDKTETTLRDEKEDEKEEEDEEEPTPLAEPERTVKRGSYLTSRLLEKTPARAGTMTSNMTASIRSSQNLSTSPNLTPAQSSDGVDNVTSRLVGDNGKASGPASSFGLPEQTASRATSDPTSEEFTLNGGRRRNRQDAQPNSHPSQSNKSTNPSDDDDDDSPTIPPSAFARSLRFPGGGVPTAEHSRTQQKLNLQRASSALESNRHRHSLGMRAGGGGPNAHHEGSDMPHSGVGGGGPGGGFYDPSANSTYRMLERTGQEYLIVRRYQNPVARSLKRLQLIPGADKGKHILKPSGHTAGSASKNGQIKRENSRTPGLGGFGLNLGLISGTGAAAHSQSGITQNYRDLREPGGSVKGPKRAYSNLRPSTADASSDRSPLKHQSRLSGSDSASLGGGGERKPNEDDGTMALLRSLWEKTSDLSASQD